jgi:YidC/Oxa1 family membrane protein insertase
MLSLTASIYSILSPLISVFETVLKFFHNTVGVGWGLSIVLLTLLIRLVLFPLALKQFHSMQRMQAHMPEMKAIQQKYKEDKQRQQQEMMKFYKENEINPFASCLPLVAQLPVFISLFYMLRADLRRNICPQVQPHHIVHGLSVINTTAATKPCGNAPGAGFLFIHDLTNKATGATLIVLILLYVGTQVMSTLMMQTPNMDQTQRRLMLLLPLFFVIFIISFPAGVILYWVTTNTWTMAQQYFIRRRLGPMGPPATATADAGGGSGGGGGPGPRTTRRPPVDGSSDGSDANGSAAGGGIGGLLRGRLKPAGDRAAVGAAPKQRAGPPPRPPRKKKKRSGRRR